MFELASAIVNLELICIGLVLFGLGIFVTGMILAGIGGGINALFRIIAAAGSFATRYLRSKFMGSVHFHVGE